MKIAEIPAKPDRVLNFNGKSFYQLIGSAEESGGTTNHSFIFSVCPVGQSFPTHYHKLCEETYFILAGTASMTVDGREFSITAGQVVVIMPGEVHGMACAGDEDVEFIAINAPAFDPTDVYLQ